MTDTQIPSDKARSNWREVMERAHWGEQIDITRNGKPYVVLVSTKWRDRAREALGETSAEQSGQPAERQRGAK